MSVNSREFVAYPLRGTSGSPKSAREAGHAPDDHADDGEAEDEAVESVVVGDPDGGEEAEAGADPDHRQNRSPPDRRRPGIVDRALEATEDGDHPNGHQTD